MIEVIVATLLFSTISAAGLYALNYPQPRFVDPSRKWPPVPCTEEATERGVLLRCGESIHLVKR